jgi:hypothetical protein
MRKAYYIISKNGEIMRHLPAEVPEGLDESLIKTLVQGWMFQDGWDIYTPYAIYLKNNSTITMIDGDKNLEALASETTYTEETQVSSK